MITDNRIVANAKVVDVTFTDGGRFVVNVMGRDFYSECNRQGINDRTMAIPIPYLTKTLQLEQ